MGPTAIMTSKSDPTRDRLGQKIAMNANTIAASTQIRGRHPGYWYSAIAVFSQPASGWRSAHPTATLTARHQSESDDYGFSLAISSSMILAGGPQGKVGNNETGTAYVFDRPAGGWRDEHDSQLADHVWGFGRSALSVAPEVLEVVRQEHLTAGR